MKNIHVLPTEKFSNLILQTNGELRLSELELRGQVVNGFTQHIYITSDEEIKEGWFFNNSIGLNKSVYIKNEDLKSIKGIYGDKPNHLQKIILTSDQDLIKYGVQAINDEFLEWFVKNPSCDFVEVTEYLDSGFSYGYKIIIPKEEPKQDWYCPKCQSYVSSESVTFEETHQICNTSVIIQEPKQERMYSEEKIDKILQKLEEIKIMINIR